MSGMVINISYLVSAVFMPVAGYIIDKKGRLIQMLYFGGIINLAGHILNLLLSDCSEKDLCI